MRNLQLVGPNAVPECLCPKADKSSPVHLPIVGAAGVCADLMDFGSMHAITSEIALVSQVTISKAIIEFCDQTQKNVQVIPTSSHTVTVVFPDNPCEVCTSRLLGLPDTKPKYLYDFRKHSAALNASLLHVPTSCCHYCCTLASCTVSLLEHNKHASCCLAISSLIQAKLCRTPKLQT